MSFDGAGGDARCVLVESRKEFRHTAILPSPAPTPEFQLAFLTKIEELLARGKFTSTYKFALLIALTNIAVENGNDTNDELEIEVDEIARQYLALYWSMARPYPQVNAILKQTTNSKKPAAIVSMLKKDARLAPSSYQRLRVHRVLRDELVGKARRTLTKYVLRCLQTVRTQGAENKQFLYEYPPKVDERGLSPRITLKRGTAACLRRLRGVIIAMVQARWALFVRQNNKQLSADCRLESFLFGANRIPVSVYAARFYDLQDGRCFYSGKRLRGPERGEVDHFIPWARYPFDSPFNLVLASRRVNNKMRDDLKPPEWRERWLRRNEDCVAALIAPAPNGFGAEEADRTVVRSVAAWIYHDAV